MAQEPFARPTCYPTAACTTVQYDRTRDLPRLVALWPSEISDSSRTGRLRLLARLRTALRRERQRGLAGHWCYDLERHAQLLAAYRSEAAGMLALQGKSLRPSIEKNDRSLPK